MGGHPGRVGTGAAAMALVLSVASCGGDDATSDTMDPIESTPGASVGTVPAVVAPPTTQPTTVDPGAAGAGFVSIHVRRVSDGVDENVSLDRGSVAVEDLDPRSLNASCTALDGGDDLTVSVVDLRRLDTTARLVSAVLRVEDGATEPGEYEGTLEVADVDQATAAYETTIILDEGGRSGSFEGFDEVGTAVSGTFACADQPIATTTTILQDVGEEVPGASVPVTVAPPTS